MRFSPSIMCLFLLIIFVNDSSLIAQVEAGGVNENSLWLVPEKKNELVETDVNNFNFHPRISPDQFDLTSEFNGVNLSLFIVNLTATNQSLLLNDVKETGLVQITNAQVVSRNALGYNAQLNKSKILFYKDNFSQRNINKAQVLFQKHKEMGLAELIFFDRAITLQEQAQIESYLSIKYGISLMPGFQYYNSNGEKTYVNKNEDGFYFRLTALGRDDKTMLYQKQSTNSDADHLFCFSLAHLEEWNSQNSGVLEDQSFLFWTDNNGTLQLGERTENIQVLNRVWKLDLNFLKENEKELFLNFDLPKGLSQNKTAEWAFILTDEPRIDIENEKHAVKRLENEMFESKFILNKANGNIQYLHLVNLNSKQDYSNNIAAFPNPIARGEKCLFTLYNPVVDEMEFTVRDAAGRITQTGKIKSNTENFQLQFMELGMHTVDIMHAGQVSTKKIIVVD